MDGDRQKIMVDKSSNSSTNTQKNSNGENISSNKEKIENLVKTDLTNPTTKSTEINGTNDRGVNTTEGATLIQKLEKIETIEDSIFCFLTHPWDEDTLECAMRSLYKSNPSNIQQEHETNSMEVDEEDYRNLIYRNHEKKVDKKTFSLSYVYKSKNSKQIHKMCVEKKYTSPRICILDFIENNRGRQANRSAFQSRDSESSRTSHDFDYFSVKESKIEHLEKKFITKNVGSIDEIVNEKLKLKEEVDEVMDVKFPIPCKLPYFRNISEISFPPLPLHDIDIVIHMITSLELNSRDKSGIYCNKLSIKSFLSLLTAAFEHQGADFHLIGTSAHVAFIHNFIHAVIRLSTYLKDPSYLFTRADFDISTRYGDYSSKFTKSELEKFEKSIKSGSSISTHMKCLENACICHSSASNLAAYQYSIDLLKGKLKNEDQINLSGLLYKIKFVILENNCVQTHMSKYKYMKEISPGVPEFWPLNLNIQTNRRLFNPMCEADNLTFTINSKKGKHRNPLNFVPGTRAYFFI